MRHVSVSQLSTWLTCPRKHYYMYTLRRVPVRQSPDLARGTRLHRWLAHLHGGEPWDPDPDETIEERLVRERYPLETAPLPPMRAEVPFEVRLDVDVTLVGVIDGVTSDWMLVEHKSVSSTTDLGDQAWYWRRLQIDLQVSVYTLAAMGLGMQPKGVLYNVLRLPRPRALATPLDKRRYTKAGVLYANQREHDESTEEYLASAKPAFARAIITRTSDELSTAWDDISSITRGLEVNGRNTGACQTYGRQCEYWPVCSGEASINGGDFIAREHPQNGTRSA